MNTETVLVFLKRGDNTEKKTLAIEVHLEGNQSIDAYKCINAF